MKIWDVLKQVFGHAMTSGKTPHQLALAFSVGIYVAFSPFPMFHAIIMVIISWACGLNFPLMFIAASVNNPWTIIPFYSIDYAFGYWFVHNLLGWNPAWGISLVAIFGSGKICLWSFLIGGNVLGVVAGLTCYPIVYYFFKKIIKNSKSKTAQ
jgi:uncharacterized protein (DUF2062 family)